MLLGRHEQLLTLSLKDRKLLVQIIPFENRLGPARSGLKHTHVASEVDDRTGPAHAKYGGGYADLE